MLTLGRAKILKKDEILTVTKTGEVWIVQGVTLNSNPNKVTVKIQNSHNITSFFDETRLSLFDLVPSPKPVLYSSEPPVLVPSDLPTKEDDQRLEERLEDNFLHEKPLTKPARKPRVKKAK